MASSPTATTTETNVHQMLAEMNRTYTTGRKVRISLPTVNEASIESIDGGAPLVPRTNKEPFAALRPQTQSAYTSPVSTASDGSQAHQPSSRFSDPTDLRNHIKGCQDEMDLMEKLARARLESPPGPNPATAEFQPTAADKAPSMLSENSYQNNGQHGHLAPVCATGASNGSNTFQPQSSGSFNAPANAASTGYGTFQPRTSSFASMSAASQAQNYMLSQANSANNGVYGSSGINRNGQAGSGFQQPVNGTNGQNGLGFGTYSGNGVQQPANGTIGTNGLAFSMPNGGGVQQTGNDANGMAMASGAVQSGSYTGMNGANGTNGSTQEQLQLSMDTLQAHLAGVKLNNYPRADSGMKPTFPQAAMSQPQSQPSYQPAPNQLQNGMTIQQQGGMNTPMRTGLANPPGQFTPASSTVFSHGQSDLTPSQYMGSPTNGRKLGRTEPPNFAPRSNGAVTNQPPPRFALQTPVPIHQQVYNNVITPSSAGGDPFSPPAVDPFNGPALPRVIQPIQPIQPIEPIEPLQNALVLHDNPVPPHIRNMRSKQLNELTEGPTRRPSLGVALSTDNFPFVDSAHNAQPTNTYGVIKLKNVSLHRSPTEQHPPPPGHKQ